MLNIAEKVLTLSTRKGSFDTEIPYCIVDNHDQYKNLNIGYICSAGKDFFVIDPSGYVRPCNHSPIKTGTVDDFMNNPYWQRFTDRDYIPSRCISCSKVNYCDGGYRESASICNGSLDSEDTVFSVI